MLRLNCVFENPQSLPTLVRLVEKTAYDLKKGKRIAPSIENVYKAIINDGLEIDLESVGYAYKNSTLPGKKGFSTKTEVNAYVGDGMKKAIRIAKKAGVIKRKTGKDSIGTVVATTIAKAFQEYKQQQFNTQTSAMKNLEDKIRRKMIDRLQRKKVPVAKKDFAEILTSVFDAEDVGGAVSDATKNKVLIASKTIDQVFAEVADDIDTIAKSLTNRADRLAFEEMTANIRNAAYDILLTTRDGEDVIKGILAEMGYTKDVTVDGKKKKVIDWNAVLSDRNLEWRDAFATAITDAGFSAVQADRVVNFINGQFEAMLKTKADNMAKAIARNHDKIVKKPNGEVLRRLIKYKNAGIVDGDNGQILSQVLGFGVPPEVAAQLRQMVEDYERNIAKTGRLSNVEAELVFRGMQNLLRKYGTGFTEKAMNHFSDYMALKASSIISTTFNSVQNITSGINAAFTTAFYATLKNPKLLRVFVRSWVNTFIDVAAGGVSIRDSGQMNVMSQLAGRGGLGDRWTFNNAKGFWGYFKAMANLIPQITATAADAANGQVIYQALTIQGVKYALIEKYIGQTSPSGQAYTKRDINRMVDNIVFGKGMYTDTDGVVREMSNRRGWKLEAERRMASQFGMKEKKTTAARIADELVWHSLVTEHGFSVDDVKAIMSAAITQKSKNLGHISDITLDPNLFYLKADTDTIRDKAEEAKENKKIFKYMGLRFGGDIVSTLNLFIVGRLNWLVLAMQNTPIIGGTFAAADALSDAARVRFATDIPLAKQDLKFGDPEKLKLQLEARFAKQGRLQRAVVGSAVQALGTYLFMTMISEAMSGADDDDKEDVKSIFEEAFRDAAFRRLIDKAAPQALAAQLSYAWDKKKGEFDEAKLGDIYFFPPYTTSPVSFIDYVYKSVIETETGWGNTKKSLGYTERIKDDDEREEKRNIIIGRFVAETMQVPYSTLINILPKEIRVMKNGSDPEKYQEEIEEWKYMMQNTETFSQAFLQGLFAGKVGRPE